MKISSFDLQGGAMPTVLDGHQVFQVDNHRNHGKH
jgi:hypothetical protein